MREFSQIDLPWSEIDTVLLDMDGTLLDLNFDNHFWKQHVPRRYAEENGISFDSAWAHILPQMQAVRGTLDWYSVHYWSEWLGLDVPSLKREVAHLVAPRPGVFEFLQRLKNHGKDIVLATNAHQDTLEIKFAQVALGEWLDQIVTSHALGAVKESRAFWDALRHQIGFDPARTLFIDDHPGVLREADAYGVAHLLGVRQPDLKHPGIPGNGFRLLDHFDQLLPPDTTAPAL